ncbi:MAG: hypothetical protein AAGB30_11015 [Pedobacter sp.]
MDLNDEFERKHMASIRKIQKKINRHYRDTIDKIYRKAFAIRYNGETFKISDFPYLAKHIDEVLVEFAEYLNIILVNGVKFEWDLSGEKNAAIILKAYGDENVSEIVKSIIYNPQKSALETFLSQKSRGLSLSDRVWKYTSQFRSEIEKNLFIGLEERKTAAEMARDQKQYLNEPDRLFRKVRDAKGKLVLSTNARNYRPGQGIYRSSYKNAVRLTRNVVNDAYRESDMVRYRSIPFILGYEIKLADNHPRYDICDQLKGVYPKTFSWRKWHVNCICFCVSKLPSMEEYEKYEDAILNGTSDGFKFKDSVTENNPAIRKYLQENREMLNRLSRKPDWIAQNNL